MHRNQSKLSRESLIYICWHLYCMFLDGLFWLLDRSYSKTHATIATGENFEVLCDTFLALFWHFYKRAWWVTDVTCQAPFVKVSEKCHERLWNFPWWLASRCKRQCSLNQYKNIVYLCPETGVGGGGGGGVGWYCLTRKGLGEEAFLQ